jgi:hypothetical protein
VTSRCEAASSRHNIHVERQTSRPLHHPHRPPQTTRRTLDDQPPDTTTVASAHNQCFPPLALESIAFYLPGVRFHPMQSHRQRYFTTRHGLAYDQVRNHLPSMSTPTKVTSTKNGPTSNPPNLGTTTPLSEQSLQQHVSNCRDLHLLMSKLEEQREKFLEGSPFSGFVLVRE